MLIKMLEMPMAPGAGLDRSTIGKRFHFPFSNFKGQLPHYYGVRKFHECSSTL
jgi:hypothetical protein